MNNAEFFLEVIENYFIENSNSTAVFKKPSK